MGSSYGTMEANTSNIAGMADAGNAKGSESFKAALRRQAQAGIGSFAKKTHERLMNSASWLGLTGVSLWASHRAKDDEDYTLEA